LGVPQLKKENCRDYTPVNGQSIAILLLMIPGLNRIKETDDRQSPAYKTPITPGNKNGNTSFSDDKLFYRYFAELTPVRRV
jgi:hypothetical protein